MSPAQPSAIRTADRRTQGEAGRRCSLPSARTWRIKAIALMLGHHWNLTPPTTVYEHHPPGYFPAIDVS